MSTTVITYATAWNNDTCDLCPRHAALSSEEWRTRYPALPSLGPVQHGEHSGVCEACTEDQIAAVRAQRSPRAPLQSK